MSDDTVPTNAAVGPPRPGQWPWPDGQVTATLPIHTSPPGQRLDVADLIDPDLLAFLTPPGATAQPRSRLSPPDLLLCRVDGESGLEFGVEIVPGFGLMPHPSQNPTPVPDLGDETLLLADPDGRPLSIHTRRRDQLFVVRNVRGATTPADADTMLAVMRSLLAHADADAVARVPAVDVGPHGPAPDAQEVEAILGTVVAARGGYADADGIAECQYVGAGGVVLSLRYLARQGIAEEVMPPEPDEDAERATVPGAERTSFLLDPYVLAWTIGPDRAWLLQASGASGTPADHNLRIRTEDALSLAGLYMTLTPGAGS